MESGNPMQGKNLNPLSDATLRESPEKRGTRAREDGLTTEQRLVAAAFQDWLEMRGMSRRTVTDYPQDVGPFLLFLTREGVENLRAATRGHLEAYAAFLSAKIYRGKPLTLRTVGSRLGQLKTFFRFLFKTGRIYHDPAAAVVLPRRGDRLPRGVLTEKEMLRLLEAPDLGTPLGLRDRAILELLYSSGLRNSELRNLQLSDLDLENRSVFVVGKGGKEAYVPFGKEAARALGHYVTFGRPHLARGYHGSRPKTPARLREEAGKEYLFLSKNGHRINESNLYHMLQRYGTALGLEKRIGPHSLRHTCATHLLRHGADIRHIQGLLRHKDLSSTQIYTRLHIEDLKEAQAKFHPRERPAGPADGDGADG